MRLQCDEWGICGGWSTGEAAVCCQGCPCFAYGCLLCIRQLATKMRSQFLEAETVHDRVISGTLNDSGLGLKSCTWSNNLVWARPLAARLVLRRLL